MYTFSKFLTLGALALLPAMGFANVEDETTGVEAVAETGINWIADFDVAQAIAKAEGKDMLVDFTGSDWCIWCKRLDEQVYAFESFQTYAAENFVMVLLDYPNDPALKAAVPNPERNAELVDTYSVGGYPTVLLMTAEGEVYGRTGFRPDGPEEYVENLGKMMVAGKAQLATVKALNTELAAATDSSRPEIFGRVLAAFTSYEAGSVGRDLLVDVVSSAFDFDADNTLGLKQRAIEALVEAEMVTAAVYTAAAEIDPNNESGLKVSTLKAVLSSGGADEAMFEAVAEMDPKNEQGLYELMVTGRMNAARQIEELGAIFELMSAVEAMGIQDSDVKTQIFMSAAHWNWKFLDNHAEARRFGLLLEAHAGEDAQVARMLGDLFGDIGREAGADGEGDDVVEEEAGQ